MVELVDSLVIVLSIDMSLVKEVSLEMSNIHLLLILHLNSFKQIAYRLTFTRISSKKHRTNHEDHVKALIVTIFFNEFLESLVSYLL